MSAKYSILVVALVAAILIVNSLWARHTAEQNGLHNTAIESGAERHPRS